MAATKLPKVVKVIANGTPTGTLNGFYNTTIFGNVYQNIGGGYNPATGVFTCPVGAAGYYSVDCGLYVSGTITTAGTITVVGIFQNSNNGLASNMNRTVVAGGNGAQCANISLDGIWLNAGDTLEIKTATGISSPYYIAPLDGSQFYLSISKDI